MVEELDVLADFHAALFGADAHGDFTEGSDRSGRHGLAAQGVERGQSLLPEQNQSAAIHAGGDIDEIRSRHVSVNGRGTTLVNVDLAGQQRLRGGGGAEYTGVDCYAPFTEITRFARQDDRQIEWASGCDGNFEARFFRL